MNKNERIYNEFVKECKRKQLQQGKQLTNKDKYNAIKAKSSHYFFNFGSFGEVVIIELQDNQNNQNKIQYAIKEIVNINRSSSKGRGKYRYTKYSEHDYLRIMEHPNIIKVYDVLEIKRSPEEQESVPTGFTDVLCIVYEYGGVSLDKYIRTKREPIVLSQIFVKICSAVAYISNLGLVHRDLKLKNITVKDEEPKIIDFGVMIFKNQRNNGAGTVGFTREKKKGVNRVRTDNFALGVILWNIFKNKLPPPNFYKSLEKNDWISNCRKSLYGFLENNIKQKYDSTNIGTIHKNAIEQGIITSNQVEQMNKKELIELIIAHEKIIYKEIIDLIIDLMKGEEEIFDIASLRIFYNKFNNSEIEFEHYHRLSIPSEEKVTEIKELRFRMTHASRTIQKTVRNRQTKKKSATKIQAVFRGKKNRAVAKKAAEKAAAEKLINNFVKRNNSNTSGFQGKINRTLGCQFPGCHEKFNGLMSGVGWSGRTHCRICLKVYCTNHAQKRAIKILKGNHSGKKYQSSFFKDERPVICDTCFEKYTSNGFITTNLSNSAGGGKKKIIKSTKKVRKHQGIYQRGPKKGKLKPGFKYSGKKTKTGLKIIVKLKK